MTSLTTEMEKTRFVPASELLSATMLAQIDRIVEQQSDRIRKTMFGTYLSKRYVQRGLSEWVTI